MSLSSRKARGIRTQVVVAEYLHSDGKGEPLYPHAHDPGSGRQGKDVLGAEGWSIEVKARGDFQPVAAMRQARTNAADGDMPVVVMRMNGQGEGNIGQWMAMVALEDMRELMMLRKRHLDEQKPEPEVHFDSYLCHVCDNIVPSFKAHVCIPSRSE